MQQRAAGKDSCADLWDYSVGEHLKPNESYAAAAHRGLAEELGIIGEILRPICGVRRREFVDGTHHDREMQMPFLCRSNARVTPDPREVQQVRWVDPAQLHAWVAHDRAAFTPWFLAFYAELDVFQPGA